MLKSSCLIVLLLLACAVSYSQEPAPVADTVKREKFNWRSTILPATFIAYGAATLTVDQFQDWNQSIKQKVWSGDPHKQVHFDNYLQWAPAATTFALGFAGVKGRSKFVDRVFIFGIAELIQSSVVATLKKVSNETRPNGSGNESFPSGHASNAFTGAEFMRLEYKDVSPWYGVLGYTLAAGTAYMRMYNNKHWLSDVIASAGTGILSTNLAYYIYPKLKRLILPKKELHTIIVPTYQSGIGGVALVHRF